MADPLSLSILALGAVSTGASVVSTLQQGKAQRAAYNTQADIAEANAKNTALETSLNEDALRRENRQKLSKILTAQGEAGLVGGTATGAYMNSFKNTEQDALNLRYQGMSQWQNYKNNAAYSRFYADQAMSQAKAGAWAQGIGGAAQFLTFGGQQGIFGKDIASKFNRV